MVVETELYETLGVSPDATASQIRKAYRRAALRVHPDRAGSDATSAFQRVQEAYATLYDAETRRLYDEFGAAGIRGDDEAAAAAAAFSRARGKRVSADEIEAFGRKYRFSAAEREDVQALFMKLDGAVSRVLDYIPYADRTDIERFLAMFDALAKDAETEVREAYAEARVKLEKKIRGYKARVPGDHRSHERESDMEGEDLGEEEEDSLADENIAEDGDEVEAPVKRKRRSTRKKAGGAKPVGGKAAANGAKKGKEKGDGMNSLIEQLRNRKSEREQKFNSFIDKLEDKYKDDDDSEPEKTPKRKTRAGSSSKKGAAGKSGAATRGVGKRSGRIAKSSSRRGKR